MAKKKLFVLTDISIPQIELKSGHGGERDSQKDFVMPDILTVNFGVNTSKYRKFDFSTWYGVGIDQITYACQIQVERFVKGQDAQIEAITAALYCHSGLRNFLKYLTLRVTALERDLTLSDINRETIDDFLSHIARPGSSIGTQKNIWGATKSVLFALGRRGVLQLIESGDLATFPKNPFPNSNKLKKSSTGLSKAERTRFANSIKQAVMPIWQEGVALTSHLLSCALIVIALHTGRNSTPLLEMTRSCLRSHPKENCVFLVLWKRRGNNTSKVALRSSRTDESQLESTPTITASIERLIRRIIALTEPLLVGASSNLRERVWIHPARAASRTGETIELTQQCIDKAFRKIVDDNGIVGDDGNPLRVNISRLRKTFGNRIFEISNGDVAVTAAALGNTIAVADRHYLKPDDKSKRNWRFLGEVLVQELLTNTIGATYKDTPLGKCSDIVNGQYAPKAAGAMCMSFLNCLRCRHYAVTEDDLYKLFSFYFRIFEERSRIEKRQWGKQYAHIPRLIDDYIIAEGLRRGIFKTSAVDKAREKARISPHPFWSVDLIANLEIVA
ncbi:hypothetical protein [Pseudomonas khavaziana]|uniref:hypothetical protein n=1 Tax=Pseudomonas khavaziana TaxID=2842351 RepID=UPI001C3C7C8E|nr:hypothetical protein [Pseudomonas khavaziana]MBV4478632.1 hypothetical protein [Pseudomonas khavaziana]